MPSEEACYRPHDDFGVAHFDVANFDTDRAHSSRAAPNGFFFASAVQVRATYPHASFVARGARRELSTDISKQNTARSQQAVHRARHTLGATHKHRTLWHTLCSELRPRFRPTSDAAMSTAGYEAPLDDSGVRAVDPGRRVCRH